VQGAVEEVEVEIFRDCHRELYVHGMGLARP
jgi:hypothetical protein